MIKAFLFDYDGVISQGVDVRWPSMRLAENLGTTEDAAAELIKQVWAPYSRGQISDDELWQIIEQNHGQPISEQQRDIWFSWEQLKPLPIMLDRIRALKEAGFKVGVLTNVFRGTKQIIEDGGGYKAFDFVIASCDVGHRKPEPEIYQLALQELGDMEPSNVVFLDDREVNVDAARALGFQGIFVSDHQTALAEIDRLLN